MRSPTRFEDRKFDAGSVVEVSSDGKGYVEGEVTYYVMDDLTMGLKLLKASLESKTVLTDVFVKKNRASNA
ncbi:hypothetical protein FCM35_KLT19811 [Carex littledalei]|uniref:Uncharacterized protein n=1 Tax=Carex littledalei TaxID=544730 RepID=A0A833R4W0_9POAL|nr:hypothetical protein FCM35_KLT19811 [Carex littledalei]